MVDRYYLGIYGVGKDSRKLRYSCVHSSVCTNTRVKLQPCSFTHTKFSTVQYSGVTRVLQGIKVPHRCTRCKLENTTIRILSYTRVLFQNNLNIGTVLVISTLEFESTLVFLKFIEIAPERVASVQRT